jgi:pantoate--beta-alanine ligase
MVIFKISATISAFLKNARQDGRSIGFVPTMGALHEGHISLIERSKKENNLTVCSIFINPTQFNNPDDFKKYPVTIEKDIDMLENCGCDILFLPEVSEIYPPGATAEHYQLGYLETILEGKYRPGHFQGVCQVVDRLLQIVMPDRLYLGQKDWQQCMVITKLVELKKIPTSIILCPTLREANGLAMSSRNQRLDPAERKLALNIFETLSFIKNEIKAGSLNGLKEMAFKNLSGHGFKTDYVEIADATDLSLVDNWDGKTKLVALAAAYLNDVRLIDNLVLN